MKQKKSFWISLFVAGACILAGLACIYVGHILGGHKNMTLIDDRNMITVNHDAEGDFDRIRIDVIAANVELVALADENSVSNNVYIVIVVDEILLCSNGNLLGCELTSLLNVYLKNMIKSGGCVDKEVVAKHVKGGAVNEADLDMVGILGGINTNNRSIERGIVYLLGVIDKLGVIKDNVSYVIKLVSVLVLIESVSALAIVSGGEAEDQS